MTSSSRICVLVALTIVAAGLAGCTSSEDTGDPEPISAREAIEEARPTVDQWVEEAELVVLSGFEGAEGSPAVQQARENQGERSYPVFADPLPGDGRAPQWVMVYLAGERSRSMRVTAQEAVWLDDGNQRVGPGAQPVGEAWTIDSTEAVEQARNASGSLDGVLAASDVSVFLTLADTESGPEWTVQATSHDAGTQSSLVVDAETGEVRNATQPETTGGSSHRFNGTLERGAGNDTHEVTVASDGSRLAARVTWNTSQAGEDGRLSASLVANGTELEPAAAGTRDNGYQARWDGLEEGSYELDIGAESWGEAEAIDYAVTVHVG